MPVIIAGLLLVIELEQIPIHAFHLIFFPPLQCLGSLSIFLLKKKRFTLLSCPPPVVLAFDKLMHIASALQSGTAAIFQSVLLKIFQRGKKEKEKSRTSCSGKQTTALSFLASYHLASKAAMRGQSSHLTSKHLEILVPFMIQFK